MSLDSQYVEPLFIVMIWKALLLLDLVFCTRTFCALFPFLKITYIYSSDN